MLNQKTEETRKFRINNNKSINLNQDNSTNNGKSAETNE